MHASIWTFAGEPDELARRYDAMVAELPPGVMRLSLCLRAPGGIVVVDTCPTRDAFVAFSGDDGLRSLCARHGMPAPERVEDFPVHAAFVDGARLAGAAS